MSIQDTKSLNPFNDGKGNKLTEKKQPIIQSFLNQFNRTETKFYQDSNVKLQKILDHGK